MPLDCNHYGCLGTWTNSEFYNSIIHESRDVRRHICLQKKIKSIDKAWQVLGPSAKKFYQTI